MKKHPQNKREKSKNWLKDRRIAREIDDIFDEMATRWAMRAEKIVSSVASQTAARRKHHRA